MLKNEYLEGDHLVKEYASGAIIKTLIVPTPTTNGVVEPTPTSEEMTSQTLLNTEYLVIMSELTSL